MGMTMRRNGQGILLAGLLCVLASSLPAAQTAEFRGQLSFWLTGNKVAAEPLQGSLGLRYIPELSLKKSWSETTALDAEASLNLFGSAPVLGQSEDEPQGRVKPYRLWARFSTERFEARLGLQKINFGSATLLRPLMWFDSLDPRDPLQVTDGVSGLLLRAYCLNNANIWAWGLYGNDDLKGWEAFPTRRRSAEFGGRVQIPVPRGEVAFTYHHRRLDPGRGTEGPGIPGSDGVPEDRFGLDGKWDVGIGLWFEGSLVHQRSELLPSPYQRALNIGLDYTFRAGNGLHILGEHFLLHSARSTWAGGEGIAVSALLLNYPLGLLDSLTGILYYDWKNEQFYRFINWQRTYDRWSFYIIGFWNPEQFQIHQRPGETPVFAGKGIEVMVVFNH